MLKKIINRGSTANWTKLIRVILPNNLPRNIDPLSMGARSRPSKVARSFSEAKHRLAHSIPAKENATQIIPGTTLSIKLDPMLKAKLKMTITINEKTNIVTTRSRVRYSTIISFRYICHDLASKYLIQIVLFIGLNRMLLVETFNLITGQTVLGGIKNDISTV